MDFGAIEPYMASAAAAGSCIGLFRLNGAEGFGV